MDRQLAVAQSLINELFEVLMSPEATPCLVAPRCFGMPESGTDDAHIHFNCSVLTQWNLQARTLDVKVYMLPLAGTPRARVSVNLQELAKWVVDTHDVSTVNIHPNQYMVEFAL